MSSLGTVVGATAKFNLFKEQNAPQDLHNRFSPPEIVDVEDEKLLRASIDSIIVSKDKKDAWAMYKCSYNDSMAILPSIKKKDRWINDPNYMLVCVIVPTFNLEEVDTELPMNVMVVKLIDSLTSYQQLLLKCSSILGEYFSRSMLTDIMVSTSPRETALAIQKLYELRVLTCAHGDFTHGDSLIFFQRFTNPNAELYIKCYCKNIKIHDFHKWLQDEEKLSKVEYTRSSGKKSGSRCTTYYYDCNRSGKCPTTLTKRKREQIF